MVLTAYLATQLVMAGLIYWLLSSAAHRQLRTMFIGAGRDHFNRGFDEAARNSLMDLIHDSQKTMLSMIYDHINKELSATTVVSRDLLADRLREVDQRLMDLRDTLRKVEQVREEMQQTGRAVGELNTKLNHFFESYNVGK
jgi:hypothetical protein